jgi:hypothetical protein
MLSGYECVKAACRTLMKLTSGMVTYFDLVLLAILELDRGEIGESRKVRKSGFHHGRI